MARTRETTHRQPANWAEWLLDLGKTVNRQLRSGAGIEEVAERSQNSIDTCKLSLVFYQTSDVVKVRALVEDWSRERLVHELGGMYSNRVEPEKARTSNKLRY
jgi:hypothetical protein